MTNLTGSNLNRREATGPKGEGRDSPSNFPQYPEYKDSGVEWLGEVPAHWDIKPLKYVATYNDEVLPESTSDDYPIKYVEISDVDEQLGITGWTEHTFSSAPSRARRILKDGDVLISTVRTYLRAIAPVIDPPENLVGSTGFAAIRPVLGIYNSALLGYALRAEWFISNIIARSVGVSYPAINASDLVALSLPVPPWKEQQAIAAFLDHETARIDALIAEQQRLIELLKEKRQAVISHAVTKGLDPDVPMKDSGVEWLGKVPAHWEALPLKYLVREPLKYGANEAASDNNSDHPRFVRITDVSADGTLRDETFRSLPPDVAKQYLLEEGDILFARSGATVGKSFLYKRSWGECCFAGYLIRARIDFRMALPEFVYFSFQSHGYWQYIGQQQIQATIQNVSAERYDSYVLPTPPVDEQARIVEHLNQHLGGYSELLETAEQSVSLLQERRSALISAAVTGKIDVRGWQPPAGSPALFEATQTEAV